MSQSTARRPEGSEAAGVLGMAGFGMKTNRWMPTAGAFWILALFAAPAPAYTVNVDVLNIRSGPGYGYSVIGTLTRGTVVNVIGTSGSWSKINSPKSGWVCSTYLANTTNLPMTWYRQVTGWICGPATVQMTAKYVTGTWTSQWTIAAYIGAGTSGANVGEVLSGLRRYAGSAYRTSYGFSRTVVIANINRNKPVPLLFHCRYLAYTGYSGGGHFSPIKGYTSGGFYIHDSWFGPGKWASTTQVTNAVNYFTGYYYRVY